VLPLFSPQFFTALGAGAAEHHLNRQPTYAENYSGMIPALPMYSQTDGSLNSMARSDRFVSFRRSDR
jgi:hypothetical protein